MTKEKQDQIRAFYLGVLSGIFISIAWCGALWAVAGGSTWIQ